jgi:(S)-2-hydroxy-acid oxidase
MSLKRFVSINDIEAEALKILPRSVRDYYRSGADDEYTLARNIEAYKRYFFCVLNKNAHFRLLIRPFSLRDVSKLDPSIRIKLKDKNGNVCFDEILPYPLAIAPTAFQRMAHPDGEIATSKGIYDIQDCINRFSGQRNSNYNGKFYNFNY